MTPCQKSAMQLSFFQFLAILEQSGTRIPNAESYVLINNNPLSYKNRKENQKVSNTAINYALSKGTSFAKKNPEFLEKNADISKIKEILVLKGIFSETNYGCVLTCQI